MTFVFSWGFSYLKAAAAATSILVAVVTGFAVLRGEVPPPSGVAIVGLAIFTAVASMAFVPALAISGATELFGLGPNGMIFMVAGALLGLSAVMPVDEAFFLNAWHGNWNAALGDAPRGEAGLYAFVGAMAGRTLAKSRRRAISRRERS